MIVSLDVVKAALDITGEDEDESLTTMIDHAAAFIEGQTKRRFDEPVPRSEYIWGTGTSSLYLAGHIDIPDDEAAPSDIVVSERLFFGEWTLLDTTEYERRGDMLVKQPMSVWYSSAEYRFDYLDGYVIAPTDVQALALELVIGEYNANASLTDESAGLTSETLTGVYSYTVAESSAGTPSAIGGGALSYTALRTLERYRRRLV